MRPATGCGTSRCATAPSSAPAAGSPWRQALEAELRGLARGERDFGVVTRVINCSLRHYAPEMSVAIARLSVAYRDRGVVAFDLAGGEAGRPPGRAPGRVRHRGRRLPRHHGARRRGGGRRVDRGGGAPLPRRPDRPRHPAVRGSGAAGLLRDRRLPIEINITSNVQTRAVARAADHPVAPVPGRRAGGHALHRRLAHDRRVADRRVLAGAHRARVHPRGDRPRASSTASPTRSCPGPSGRRCWRR